MGPSRAGEGNGWAVVGVARWGLGGIIRWVVFDSTDKDCCGSAGQSPALPTQCYTHVSDREVGRSVARSVAVTLAQNQMIGRDSGTDALFGQHNHATNVGGI